MPFTADVNDPKYQSEYMHGTDAPKSIFGVVGQALSNTATIFDKYAEQQKNQVLGNEDADLSQAIRDYASGTGPNLAGQSSNPADSSPTVQAAKSEMDKVASAAAQGSPGAKQQMLTRLSEIASRYVASDPRYAADIRNHAQSVLGFNVNAQLFNEASQGEDFSTKVSQAAQEGLINTAVQSGAAHWNSDGSLNQNQTLLNGQQIAQEKARAEKELAAAQLASAQSKTSITDEQQSNMEFRASRGYVDSITNSATNGLLTQMSAIIGNLPQGQPLESAKVGTIIGVSRAKAVAAFDQWAADKNLSSSTIDTYHKYIRDKFTDVEKVFGGDLSNTKLLVNAIQDLKNRNIADFHQVAPHAAAAQDIGGPQAASAVLQSVISPATPTEANTTMVGEVDKYFNAPPSLDEALKGANGIMSGNYRVANEPNALKAKAAMTGALSALDALSERPNKLDDKEQKVVGNVVSNASEAALATNDPAQILNAGSRLLRPGTVQALIIYGKNPANANETPKTLALYGQYVKRAQIEAARVLSTGGDTTVFVPATSAAAQSVYGADPIAVHYSATADVNGSVVPTFSATRNGQHVVLTDEQKRYVLSQDKGFVRTMGTYVQSIKADKQVLQAFSEKDKSDAQPPPKQADSVKANPVFSGVLNEILPNARITSGHRTQEENSKIGGVNNSLHLKGQAIDFVPKGNKWTQADLDNFSKELDMRGIPHTELFIEDKNSPHSTGYHIHWGWGSKSV